MKGRTISINPIIVFGGTDMATRAVVIDVDPEKCLNCHACIAVCPVKMCNDASGDHVVINHDRCIACGRCISACTHDARYYVDDWQRY